MGATPRSTRLFIPLLLVLLVGCGSSGTTGGTPGPVGQSAPATASAGAANGGNGGGNIAAIDGCALLTPAEIESALGSKMNAGVKSAASGNKTGCKWEATEATSGLEVDIDITPFDQDLWNGETAISGTEAVPGVGDAAFRGFVSDGVILIKKGALEVDITIIAVFLDKAKVASGQLTLSKLVVSRL